MHVTIAEAKAALKTHAVMRCRCGSKWLPFALLPRCSDDTAFADIAGRYRCQRCGQRPTYDGCIDPHADIKKGGY